MSSKDQWSEFDEIMEKINAIQKETNIIDESHKLIHDQDLKKMTEQISEDVNPVDGDLFDQIKQDRNIPSQGEEKSALRRFLDEEEDENEEEEEYAEKSYLYDDPPEDISDFESEDERDEIYRDLKNIVGKMAVKALFLFLLSLVSIYLFVAEFYPVLFAGRTDSIFFDIANLAVSITCMVVSFGIFIQGLSRLLHAKADTDSLLALLAVSVVVVRVVEMIRPDFLPYALNFEPFLAIGLYFNVLAKKNIASNIKRNFKLISIKNDKLTVSVPHSCETNNDLILETGEGGEIMYAHPTKLVSGYIDHSYCDFTWDRKLYRYFFFTLILIVVATVAISQLSGWGAAILFPAASLSLSVPFFSRYYYALSIVNNGRKIRKKGGVLTSADSAKELEDSDLLVVAEEDLLDNDTVLLQGVKAIGELQIDDLITYIATLFNKVGTPLKPLFLKMIDEKTVSLPRIDDIYYHEGMGYSCLIHSKMFLVGNRALMEQFNIEIPSSLLELKLKDSRYPVYVSYHKSAAGIFIASFEQNKHALDAAALAEDECVGIGVVSNDFLLDHTLLRKLYPTVQSDLFRLISTKTGAKCKEFLQRKDKSPDLIASISGLKGLLACLYGSSKLLSALKINTIIRILYPILAIGLMFFIALAGYAPNTALQIMAFQLIWMVPVWLVCTFCK
ncbi:MAG: hypothetical protein IJN34_07055 [Clostridia bacterium]|nr:hypothetical protein [Clostridia bacterium]